MELKSILEAILFASQKPLTPRELRDLLNATAEQSELSEAKAFKKQKEEDIVAALESLERDHSSAARSYRLACIAGSWQFVSQPEFAPWLKTLVGEKSRPPRLSQPALETLAIIAYRQPLTRAEIEQIRGVAVDGVMQTLLERGLVESAGRAEVIGRPMTYATTPQFLEYFGLRGLEELPAADELRKIVVKKPESLLTVDPGLATAPPDSLAPTPDASASQSPEAAAPNSIAESPPTDSTPPSSGSTEAKSPTP
jgi:segregation and condensation protein B